MIRYGWDDDDAGIYQKDDGHLVQYEDALEAIENAKNTKWISVKDRHNE